MTAQETFKEAERLRDSNNAELAIPLYYHVIDDAVAPDDLQIGARHMLGVSYRMVRNFDAAEEWLLAALSTATKLGFPESMLVNITNDLAETMRQKGDLIEAKRYIDTSFSLLDSGNPHARGITFGFDARIETTAGNLPLAISRFRIADDLLSTQVDRRPWLHMLPYWAEAVWQNGQYIESRRVSAMALVWSLRLRKSDRAAQALLLLVGGPRLMAWVQERRKK